MSTATRKPRFRVDAVKMMFEPPVPGSGLKDIPKDTDLIERRVREHAAKEAS